MKHTLAALFIAVPTTLLSTSVMSAAGVVEAQPYPPGQASNQAQPGGSSTDALVMLLDQFREMRAEMQTLRGLVEEQGYELRNLQRDSMDRYTDLDSRLSALSSSSSISTSSGGLSTSTSMTSPNQAQPQVPSALPGYQPANASSRPGSTAPVNANTVPIQSTAVTSPPVSQPVAAVNSPSGAAPVQPTMLSEQQQYQVALDSLLKDEQYQRATTEFDQYLSLYPNGRFVTNAYYWKGQAYLNLAMLNEARDAFEVIVNQYPDGRKVDDAMYSLGAVYDKLGDTDKARQLLRQVQSRYPNTSAANLAEIYLRSIN